MTYYHYFGVIYQASSGWLDRFKKRHGIRELKLLGEKASADFGAAEMYKDQLDEFILEEGYEKANIYNADESGLFWKILPDRTLALKTEMKVPGGKLPKDRVTIMVCANATGSHKIDLLVIGKSKTPRCFPKNRQLPVVYSHSKKAWMNQDIFKDWYKDVFIPAVKERQLKENDSGKVLLLLDNAPSHPSADELNEIDDHFHVKYLPPNTTAIIQPMDQHIIAILKRSYRTEYLAQSVKELENGSFKFTLFDAILLIKSSWSLVTQSALASAWKPLLDREEAIELVEEDLVVVDEDPEITEWINVDEGDQGYGFVEEDDIEMSIFGELPEDNSVEK